tara:strand:+ start:393 stop:512 length:120 start_codon:yes stop_codon:yes gene_type:complete
MIGEVVLIQNSFITILALEYDFELLVEVHITLKQHEHIF